MVPYDDYIHINNKIKLKKTLVCLKKKLDYRIFVFHNTIGFLIFIVLYIFHKKIENSYDQSNFWI